MQQLDAQEVHFKIFRASKAKIKAKSGPRTSALAEHGEKGAQHRAQVAEALT